MTVVCTLLGLAVCLCLIYRIGKNYGSPEISNLYTAPQALLYVLGIFCQQGLDVTPVTWSCRIVYWISYLTAIVIFSAYSGALVSSLANQRIVPPFTTFQGLLKHGQYKVATVADSSHLTTFQDSTDELLRRIYEELFDKNNLPSTFFEGANNICSIKNYAFIASYASVLALSKNISCGILALKKASLPENLGFVAAKNFPYLGLINFKLANLQRSGILNRIRSDELLQKLPEEKVIVDERQFRGSSTNFHSAEHRNSSGSGSATVGETSKMSST
ncbi:hypothetical protein L9F63_027417 [Diploptera punctata]|uniref:Ionotropic glutamate receptor C-terminal domain-containing protein n=1 Tax=Diploptera punctata TaxID=6984 RepID=A0AAD8A9I7_DIPPU|nr:hypothetical protein L9F63_027417 [Diploptera punctata]